MTVNTLSAAAANAANDRTGEEVDGAVLLVPLGVGQFAETWLAAAAGGTLLAVKLFSSRLGWTAEETQAFLRGLPDGEYPAGGIYQGAPYLKATYRPAIPLSDLARAAKRAGRTIPATVAARIVVDAVEALAHAPKLHLAVHARHLLVDDDGRTVVVETGSAARLFEMPRFRRTATAERALPPEVAEGTADLTSDFCILARAVLQLPLGPEAALLVSALRGVAADERRLRPRDASALRAHLSDVPTASAAEVLAWRDSVGRKLVLRRNQSLATAAARANVAIVPPAMPPAAPAPPLDAGDRRDPLSAPPPARSGTQRATGRTPRFDPLGFALDELPLELDVAEPPAASVQATPSKSPGDTAEWTYGDELAALRDDVPAQISTSVPVREAGDGTASSTTASVRGAGDGAESSTADATNAFAPAVAPVQTLVPASPTLPRAAERLAGAAADLARTLPERFQELPGYQKAMVIVAAILVLCLFWRIVH